MKRNSERSVEQKLKDHPCYVLITCDSPSENGDMRVNMTYKGDALLASYLLQGAQNLMDEKVEEEFSE